MFDIWQIAAHALWIFGLAVLLATWSFGYYEGQHSGQPVLPILLKPNYHLALTIGLVLFFAGLTATDTRPWAKIIWGMLGLAAIVLLTYYRRIIS